MHKNLVELNKAINAGAVSENGIENERQRRGTPLSASSPRCVGKSERTVWLCHKNAKSSWWVWPYYFKREDNPEKLCISLAFWKSFFLKAEGSYEYGWFNTILNIDTCTGAGNSCLSSLLCENKDIRPDLDISDLKISHVLDINSITPWPKLSLTLHVYL